MSVQEQMTQQITSLNHTSIQGNSTSENKLATNTHVTFVFPAQTSFFLINSYIVMFTGKAFNMTLEQG